MTENVRTIEAYMDGFRRTDRALVRSCLAEDVAWEIPGMLSIQGKDAFDQHIVADGVVAGPEITVTRLIEADDLVVAEGRVHTRRTDGTSLDLAFCDVFEMHGSKIRRLISYLVVAK